jgi:hypothetical protein
VTAEKALELGLIDGILSETAGGTPKTSAGGVNVMKLADFLAANPGAEEEIASYALEKLGMEKIGASALANAEAAALEKSAAAVRADRERVLELLDLSGVKISASLREAVADGADSGDFAKSRVKELTAALGASNAGSLGSPKAEQNLGDQIAPKDRTPEDAVTDEERLRGMAKKGGF